MFKKKEPIKEPLIKVFCEEAFLNGKLVNRIYLVQKEEDRKGNDNMWLRLNLEQMKALKAEINKLCLLE